MFGQQNKIKIKTLKVDLMAKLSTNNHFLYDKLSNENTRLQLLQQS